MINEHLPNLQDWITAFSEALIPVLPSTVTELSELRVIEEAHGNVDARLISQNLGGDPLMTLKVLRRVSMDCARRQINPPETLTAAILMHGIGPFFDHLNQVASVVDWLHGYPEALAGLLNVIKRSRRAARFAVNFSIHRQDEDAELIQEAALLHDFAEMLLWCHAPKLALQIAQQQKADHTLRSAVIQESVLGVQLGDLAQALMGAWHLPALLIKMTDDRHANHPQVRTVMLAVRIARHTQYGWNDRHAEAALPDDIADVAQLLTLSNESAQRKITEIDS
ncbi:MAG: HDOD domain-containing protein [Burkholderiales bacterium]|nr:HDOD domain-containing protein [Burkholderiales bacterium]